MRERMTESKKTQRLEDSFISSTDFIRLLISQQYNYAWSDNRDGGKERYRERAMMMETERMK